MRAIKLSVGPLAAANASAIVASVTPTAGLTLTLTTSPYVMDKPRRVLVTYGAEGTARTLTLTGTNLTGQSQSETITVPITGAGTVSSVLDYATVTSIVSGSAFTNAITIGTSSVASSSWGHIDAWAPAGLTAQCNVTGTANYTVQTTMDEPNSSTVPVNPANVVWINWPDLVFVAAAASYQSITPSFSPTYVRITLNSGTGSVAGTFLQSGSVTY